MILKHSHWGVYYSKILYERAGKKTHTHTLWSYTHNLYHVRIWVLVCVLVILLYLNIYSGYLSVGKETACHAGDPGSIPGSGRSPGEGNCNPLQRSCLGNLMNGGAWQATVRGITMGSHNLAIKPLYLGMGILLWLYFSFLLICILWFSYSSIFFMLKTIYQKQKKFSRPGRRQTHIQTWKTCQYQHLLWYIENSVKFFHKRNSGDYLLSLNKDQYWRGQPT